MVQTNNKIIENQSNYPFSSPVMRDWQQKNPQANQWFASLKTTRTVRETNQIVQ